MWKPKIFLYSWMQCLDQKCFNFYCDFLFKRVSVKIVMYTGLHHFVDVFVLTRIQHFVHCKIYININCMSFSSTAIKPLLIWHSNIDLAFYILQQVSDSIHQANAYTNVITQQWYPQSPRLFTAHNNAFVIVWNKQHKAEKCTSCSFKHFTFMCIRQI